MTASSGPSFDSISPPAEAPSLGLAWNLQPPEQDEPLQEQSAASDAEEEAQLAESPEHSAAQTDSDDAFALIAAVAAAGNRWAATEQLVRHLAAALPDATIRCGIGGRSLRRFYDARLGWLEPENHLRTAAANQWADQVHRSTGVRPDGASLVATLPQPGGGRGRCLLWIESRTDEPVHLPWLEPAVESIATVLWGRPRWAKPAWLRWSSRRPALAIGGAGLLITAVLMWPIPYRVDCIAVIEPVRQRVIAAPFEATLMQAKVQPGDTVEPGDTLAVLDGRPLRLERETIASEIQQVSKDHDIALAAGRIAEAQQAELKRRGLERRYELLSDRLTRLEVTSPIGGVVIQGDLQRHVGSPLDSGQTLLEVAPLDRLTVEVEIPEHDIGYVEPGAEARVRIDAVGGESFLGSLDRVNPAAELRQDRNVFVARMIIPNPQGDVRPGMRGEAVTYGPLRPIAWGWIRSAVESAAWWLGY